MTRVVKASIGHAAAMKYEYRIRIETENFKKYFLFGKVIPFHRWVLERKYGAWSIQEFGPWSPDLAKVRQWGNKILDEIERLPKGEYI